MSPTGLAAQRIAHRYYNGLQSELQKRGTRGSLISREDSFTATRGLLALSSPKDAGCSRMRGGPSRLPFPQTAVSHANPLPIPLEDLSGVTPARLELLGRLGLRTVGD